MHSGVFAVTPVAAASVVRSLIDGRLVAARLAEVRDIDEAAFQQGQVRTAHYGELLIPDDQLLVQCVKCSGLPDDALQLDELSAWLAESMEPDVLYVLGSGGTLFDLKQRLGLPSPTLLGVDLWCNGEQAGVDLHEQALYEQVCRAGSVQIFLSVIGGQGVVLGRGNQQISARILQRVGIEALHFVATPKKLQALAGRALVVDSGDDELDRRLAGFRKVITGYDDAIFYPIRYLD
jgi:predicted polyphosphate/ATP-dependent NAD kinase